MARQRRTPAVGDERTTRRDYLLATTTVGATVLAGCSGGGSDPEYPGGTVVLDNQSDGPERFHVAVATGADAAPLAVDLDGGQREVHEGYVSTSEGTAVTLEGWFGIVEEGIETVEFYPSGGGGDGPQVAHMVLTNAVSVEWHWETAAGT
jgi:hypothetical protein